MLDLSIIYLPDLKKRMPYSDLRSIRTWLSKFGVEVYGEKSSKRQYVFSISFERAVLQKKINDLNKSGNNWTKDIASDMALYEKYKNMLETKSSKQRTPTIIKKENKTLGYHASKFLRDLELA